MIAAIAKVHQLTVVTRNVTDFTHLLYFFSTHSACVAHRTDHPGY